MFIHELALSTNHLERQREFYTRVLGLPLRTLRPGQFELAVGSSTLIFTATKQPEALTERNPPQATPF